MTKLRHSFIAYRANAFTFGFLTLLAVWFGVKSRDWHALLVPAGFTLYISVDVYLNQRYKIFYDGTGVVMEASGSPPRRLIYDEIVRVDYEIGLAQSSKQVRPYRRIAIYDRKHSAKTCVDVSLRHFNLVDIRNLLANIHTRRPDLKLPEIPEISSAT